MIDHLDWILEHFDYLISDFGFCVGIKEYQPHPVENALVRYQSTWMDIEIVIDRDQVLIALCTPGASRQEWREWIEYSKALHYFAPAEVAYLDPAQIFEQIRPNCASNEAAWEAVILAQLCQSSEMLRRCCEPALKGDVDVIKEIKEGEKKQVRKILKQWGAVYPPE